MQSQRLRRVTIGAVSATLAAVLALSGCSGSRTVEIDAPTQVEGALPEDTVTQLSDAVTRAMTASGSTGAIVGVWAPWSGSWVTGAGTTSVEDSTEVDTDMSFRASRITRPMTCDVLYSLDAEGVLDADDSVTDYVSGVPNLEDVSLRELCDSTSGVGSYSGQLQSMWINNPDRVWNARELAAYGLARSTNLGVGEAFKESDAGYLLLGLALERATTKSAADLIEEYVTEPLQLTATSLPPARAASPAEGAVLDGLITRKSDGAYNCAEPVDVTQMSSSVGFTDAGVVSNITDLGRYAQALATGALMSEDTDRFANPKPAYADAPDWDKRAGGAVLFGSLVGQFGAVPGYATSAFSDPESGLTVAVVLNNSTAGAKMAAYLSWELAALASKAPAAGGETAPEAGLPWTPEQYRDLITKNAICAPAE